MLKGFAIGLVGLTLLIGCVELEDSGQRVSWHKIVGTPLSGESFQSLPFHYRVTDSSVADVSQILSDDESWLSVAQLQVGHPTFPIEGYHWYALRLSNEAAQSISMFLIVEGEWWSDYRSWKVDGERDGVLDISELKDMDVLGVRYPLVIGPNDTVTVFIRFRVTGPSLTHINYFLSSDTQGMVEERSVVIGLYIGFMILMLIYNLGFFVILRERAYLYFSGLILAIGGLLLAEFGFWIFVDSSLFQRIETITWLTLCFLFFGLTVNRIVFESRPTGELSNLLQSVILRLLLAILGTVWFLWFLSGFFTLFLLTCILHGLVGFVAVYVVLSAWRDKQPFMGNLLLALIPIAIATMYVPLLRMGLLPDLFGWTYFHLAISVFFQAMVCSILPIRFQKEVISRQRLTESLEAKQGHLDEISSKVNELTGLLDKLEEEDAGTRAALVSTQDARMNAERKLRDAYQQLRHLEYQVSLGRLVAGVAHDIGNPATHISGCAQSFRSLIHKLSHSWGSPRQHQEGGEWERLDQVCSKLESESSYIVRVNRALARYGRIDDEVTPGIELQEVTEQVLCVLASRLGMHEVDCRLDNLPKVTAKLGQISQLFANLILNAADAASSIAEHGRIEVRGKETTFEGRLGILVTISDSGPGIPDMIRRAGFRPFVTTRNPAHWLGIGLSISQRIVAEHGGTISFPKLDPVAGGVVTVWLPSEQNHAI